MGNKTARLLKATLKNFYFNFSGLQNLSLAVMRYAVLKCRFSAIFVDFGYKKWFLKYAPKTQKHFNSSRVSQIQNPKGEYARRVCAPVFGSRLIFQGRKP